MKNNGFTLIELVMIIILLGIVSAVAIPRFWDMINPSKENVTKHRMEELRKSIVGNPDMTGAGTLSARGFRGDTGLWPIQLSDLVTQPANGLNDTGASSSVSNWNRYTRKGWNGPYVDSSGTPPAYSIDAWGNNFTYRSPTTCNPPVIISNGTDGILNTAGCIKSGDDIVVELRY